MECETLSVGEAAGVLGVGKGRLYDALSRGLLPAIRWGRSYRIPKSAVEKLLRRPRRFTFAEERREEKDG